MNRAASWTALAPLLVLVVGCAASTVTTGASGTGGADGGVDAGGFGGAMAACSVTLTPVSPATLNGLVPGQKVRVRAQANGPVAANARWIWSAAFADGSGVAVSLPMTADPALAEIVVADPGGYAITASFNGGARLCEGAAHFVVVRPGARAAFFAFQLTPPPNTLPAQQLEPRQVQGGTPTGENLLMLDAGTQVSVRPQRKSNGTLVGAYIKAIETSSGLSQEGHTVTDGGMTLALPPGRYDLLIVPDEALAPVLPPVLIVGQRPVDLATMTFEIDEGVAVSGRLTDATGAPLAGAKLSLRAGALPSTVGVSDATGLFSLRARPGTYGATVAPGAALPAMELAVAAAPGVTIANTPTTMSLRLAALPTARVGLTVTGAGAGAKALIEGLAPVAGAAMVEIAGGGTTTMRAATMRVRASLTLGTNGAAQTGALPRGHYRATVFAASAAPTAATVTTLADIDATAGDANGAMTMAQPVAITGTLQPGSSTRFARVLAIDDDAPLALAPDAVTPFLTEADDTGGFLLRVNPSRLYRLIVEPPPGGAFARVMLPSVPVSGAPVVVPAHALPAALLYGGRVLGPHLEPIAGTLVSAFCVAGSPGCVDSTRPIAEGVTGGDGAFRLTLPDPGFAP
ncbi:MAG: carboxypeptidase-like regulatory domain-containing protein [Bacteroidota bacterium]